MTNEYETIKEWVGNNFMFNLPDAIYNLDACLRSRLHITFKGISGIYIIRNLITDKVYIGSTNKYLYKNFEVRIYPCNVDRDFLYDVEEYLIQEYDSYTNGYNMSEDSRCKNYWTEEERRETGLGNAIWARGVQKNIKGRLERLSQSRTLEKGTLIRN